MQTLELDKWIKVAAMLATAAVSACTTDAGAPGAGPEGEDEAARPGAGADELVAVDLQGAIPGFGIEISVSGDDVVLDWSSSNINGGTDFVVYRSVSAGALLEIGIDGPQGAGVDELAVTPGETSLVDAGAASQSAATPNYFYRVAVLGSGGVLQSSTMVMKTTEEIFAGFNKFGMCMLDGPDNAQDVYDRLGGTPSAIWGWDPAAQSYVGWTPGDAGPGFSLGLGEVVVAQYDGTGPAFQSLVGVVPGFEAFEVSTEPGLNWGTVPVFNGGPAYGSHWVDEVGYFGVGRWNNDTQDATWYWGPEYDDIPMEACRPYYFELPTTACSDSTDCAADSWCFHAEEAVCGERAAGLCFPFPLGCEANEVEPVCGCDGQTYDNECEAAEAGVSVSSQGACETCEPIEDFDEDFGEGPGLLLQSTGDWGLYTTSPQSTLAPVPFGSQVLGTDGNRSAPYPGAHDEESDALLGPVTLDEALSFRSWHVDEGGGTYDRKRIVFEPEDGTAATVLVDCNAGINTQAFCNYNMSSRPGDDWDQIVLDTAALAGQTGNLRLEYDTIDSCCSTEQGWYLDDFIIGDCVTPLPPVPDEDGCLGDPCFPGVTCEDVPAPGEGFTCGDCPEGTAGDGVECLPVATTEIGGLTNSADLGPYFRGNVYNADADGWLDSFEVYLDIPSACDLDFYVYESDGATTGLSSVWQGTVSGQSGTGYHSSGPIDLRVNGGSFYTLGVAWNCSATYYWDNGGWTNEDGGIGTMSATRWDNAYPGSSEGYVAPNNGSALTAYPQRVHFAQ